jgi:Nif-specific regulatory protein
MPVFIVGARPSDRPVNIEATLVTTLSVLKGFLDMGNGLIALRDPTGEPEIVVSRSISKNAARRYFDARPERAIGQLVATEMPLVVENVALDMQFPWDTSAWGAAGLALQL